eukprot:Gb_27236 [translate_table: standard]
MPISMKENKFCHDSNMIRLPTLSGWKRMNPHSWKLIVMDVKAISVDSKEEETTREVALGVCNEKKRCQGRWLSVGGDVGIERKNRHQEKTTNAPDKRHYETGDAWKN